MTCVEYLCVSIKNVYLVLEGNKADLKPFRYLHCPYPSSYRPELEVRDELDAEFTNRFQHLMRVLRCSIELRRIYIIIEVSCLS